MHSKAELDKVDEELATAVTKLNQFKYEQDQRSKAGPSVRKIQKDYKNKTGSIK